MLITLCREFSRYSYLLYFSATYVLYYSHQHGSGKKIVNKIAGITYTHSTLSKLEPKTSYLVWVGAIVNGVSGPNSTSFAFSTKDIDKSDVRIEDITATEAKVSWTQVKGFVMS